MAVDMHEYRFISRIRKLPPFEPGLQADAEVNSVDFPAWRALFTELLLWGHSTGYRLPTYEDFFDRCRKAFTYGRNARRFAKWFDEPRRSRTERRVKAWYESGMAETHLYTCLIDAFEDILRDGVVLYDPRADWKLKWDVAVLTRGQRFAVNSAWGERSGRRGVDVRRDRVERVRKERTSASSHWGNAERGRWTTLSIFRSDEVCQVVNGLRLFSMDRINELLESMYSSANFDADERFFFPLDDEGRLQLYLSMV